MCIREGRTAPVADVDDDDAVGDSGLVVGQPGILKPDIVFFGQDLPQLFYGAYISLLTAAHACTDRIREDTAACDLVLVIGSSLRVMD